MPPLTSLLARRRVTRSSRYAARGRRLRSVGCTRAPWAPVAGSSPSLRRPSRCHLQSVPLQASPQHCAPFTPPVPRTSTAARRRSSQKCMRSSCVRSHGSASPLRRGAAARQFPPSLCRCADYPLRGIPLTPGGAPRPPDPAGALGPLCWPFGPLPVCYGGSASKPPLLSGAGPRSGGLKGILFSHPSSMGRPSGGLRFRLPYPSQWKALQSVSVPGGNQRHSRCAPHLHGTRPLGGGVSPHLHGPPPEGGW